jgi:hypothetical protein
MGRWLALALAFGTSAAVLVLEILAGRLLAPYVGVSLETYTGIIGTVLAAIALGTALGGVAADRIDPRRLLGPVLLAGGVLAWLALPVLSWLGPRIGDGPAAIVVLTGAAFFLPAAVLSTVTPLVAKLRLHDVAHTGEVVGNLSAAGTAGALVGTFLTGFVLVAAWPSRPIVVAVGLALVVAGLALWFRHATAIPSRGAVTVVIAVLAVSAGLAATTPSPCQQETAYFCVTIRTAPDEPSARILWLDTLRHSYVDLEDPTHLEFRYIRLFDDVVAATHPDGDLDVLHIGGGGFTFPRYLDATRDGTNVVLEVDVQLVRIAEDELGLVRSEDLVVEIGDARLSIEDEPTDAYDIVVGDAFGGLSVPWHLTTREMVVEVQRVLRDDGVYVLNVIDGGPYELVRAELATLGDVFEHVAVIEPSRPSTLPQNHVLVASDAPLDALADPRAVDSFDGTVVIGPELADARVLTDDFAPVDQLLTRR